MSAKEKLLEANDKMRSISRKNVPWYLFYGFVALIGIGGMLNKTELMARCAGFVDGVNSSLELLEAETNSDNS